jgi:hypothetical protein
MIQITAPLSPGSSGSPVLDESGNVIGIATQVLKEGQNLNFAIAVEELTAALVMRGVTTARTATGTVGEKHSLRLIGGIRRGLSKLSGLVIDFLCPTFSTLSTARENLWPLPYSNILPKDRRTAPAVQEVDFEWRNGNLLDHNTGKFRRPFAKTKLRAEPCSLPTSASRS